MLCRELDSTTQDIEAVPKGLLIVFRFLCFLIGKNGIRGFEKLSIGVPVMMIGIS